MRVTPGSPATAWPSIDSHGDRFGSEGIAGRLGCFRRDISAAAAGVDVGEAADGSSEPHTEFDVQRATSEDCAPALLRWRVAKVMRKSSVVRPTDRLVMWAARVAWALLPVSVVASIAAGLESRSDAVALTVAIGLWIGWAVALGAYFVPNTITLTIVRIVVPVSIVAIAIIGPTGGFDIGDGLALASTIAVTALCFLPAVGAVFLHGIAYGDEERVALRARPASS